MAIYEYACAACGRRSEVERKMSERFDDQICLHCGGKETELVPSLSSFSFSCGGFYATDYKMQGGGKKKAGK